ncbi:MAG TPA: TRAP transporter large permease subunit [Tepidisphaeraceae bacterium]|jgi:TRAP-type C4-dicarboxylate transport system permease large subunit
MDVPRLDPPRGYSDTQSQAHSSASLRFLSRGFDLLAAADHHRRRQSFGWPFAYLRGAIVIAEWLTALAGNDPHLIMLLLVLLFTVIGDFIEPVPTIIIFMPLVNALTQAADINPVHMGVVLIATLAFGLITPPYGLLMASKFIGVRFSQALRAAVPIYLVFLGTITFTIYFPTVVLWLPKQVIPESVGCFKNPSGAGYICPG